MTNTFESIRERIKVGELAKARQLIEAVETTDENRNDLLFLEGCVQEHEYDRAGARATYERVLESDPDHGGAMFRLALLYDQGGDTEAALELYRRCAAWDEVPINILINLALLLEESGYLQEASACLKNVLDKHPNQTRARQILKSVESSQTMVYDEKGQWEHEHRVAILDRPITDFELSVRARNCLRQMNIRTLGDLLGTSEAELLGYKNFGETSLNEIKALLAQMEMRLGQTLQPVKEPRLPTVFQTGEISTQYLNSPVAHLELSVRSRKCVQMIGVSTVGELIMHSEAELLAAHNFGQTSLQEIKGQLARYGLSLRA